MLKRSFLFLIIFLPFFILSSESYPYIPYDNHDWFIKAVQLDQRPLYRKVVEIQPQVAIEVGCSLKIWPRLIVNNQPENGLLYAVDTWISPGEDYKICPEKPYLYQIFLSNIQHAGLVDKIIPIKMESLEAAKHLEIQADFIYINKSRDFESLTQEIISWYAHLNEGGLICGNNWQNEEVQTAVINCAYDLGKEVYYEENFWWYE